MLSKKHNVAANYETLQYVAAHTFAPRVKNVLLWEEHHADLLDRLARLQNSLNSVNEAAIRSLVGNSSN